MANQSIVDDLKRVKTGVMQRGPRWEALDKALKDAEVTSRAQVAAVTKKMGGSYNLDWPLGLETAQRGAYSDTYINGLPIRAFMGMLSGPVMHGFFWFQAIFNVLHGSGQNAYDMVHSAFQDHGVQTFEDMTSPTRAAEQLGKEFDRLIRAVGGEKSNISKPDADKAITAMLLAPMLFPPASAPDAKAIEVQIEWHSWQILMPDIADNIYADALAAKVYEDPAKTNLDVLFDRLGDLVMGAYKANVPLTGGPEMADLEKLRKGLENRTITQANFGKTLPPINLTVPVSFPPKVLSYVRAHGFEETQKIYLGANRMTFAEAGL